MIGEISALTSSMVWACASLLFAALGASMHPVTLNLYKCVIALLMMLVTQVLVFQFAVFSLSGTWQPFDLGIPFPEMSSREWIWLSLSGLLGLSIGDTAFFNALNRLGPRRTLLVSALTPAITALLAIPVLQEGLDARVILGMMLTMAGVVWVIRERSSTGSEEDVVLKAGLGFALIAVAAQSGGNVLTKLGASEASALEISMVRLLAGILGLVVYMVIKGRSFKPQTPWKTRDYGLLILATFLGTYLGIWLMNSGLKYAQTAVATTLNSTSPIFILPLAYFILKEKISWRSVGGAVVAVLGVALLFSKDMF